MRILFIAPYTPLLTKPRPYNFLMHLAKQHDVYLVCFEDMPLDKLENRPDFEQLKSQCKYIERIPIPTYKIAMNLANGLLFTKKPLRVAYYGKQYARGRIHDIVKKYKIDAIHVDRSRFAELAADIDLPKVLDLTDSITWYLKQCLSIAPFHYRPLYRLESSRMSHYEKSVGLAYNQCLITSELDKTWFQNSLFYDRVNVVPNAVDQSFFANDIPQPETNHTLMFFGNLSYYPNVDSIKHFSIHVFPTIQKQIADVELQIIGNKPAREIQYLAENPSIHVTGWVPSLVNHIAAASVIISPMRIGVGFPNKVAESLAIGKAVVCTDIGCQGLAGSDQALLVAHNDKEFAEAVIQVLSDRQYREQLEKRAWSYARAAINPSNALALLDGVYAKL